MAAKTIESRIVIHAPIEKVWRILSNLETYIYWNPFTPKIELKKKIGSDVILHVRLNPKRSRLTRQKEELLVWDEEQKLIEWGITDAWYVQTVRIQRLKALDANTTEYYTSDTFKGPLTWLIMMLFQKKIQIGFDDVCKGLKSFVEQSN